MDKIGDMIQLNFPPDSRGFTGPIMIVVSDYVNKTVSLIQIGWRAEDTRKIRVWEVQDYTKVGE